MAKKESPARRAPALTWEGISYVRVPEGRYQAVATRWQGPEWVLAYSRWSLLVEFELLNDGSRVCTFYNFGEDRGKPKIFQKGRYRKEWTRANGDSPRKGEDMTPNIFLDGQVFIVEVRDCRRDAKERAKADAEVYSVVSEIVSVAHPSLHSPNQKSINQESGITQSTNQAINQSGLATGDRKFASFA